jgi:integrase
MRTWDRLSAAAVRRASKPGRYADGGGLVLQVTEFKGEPGNVNRAWLFRYQIDKRERWMGLGSARVVSLGEARAKANEARRLLASGIDPIAHRDAARLEAKAAAARLTTFRKVLDMLLDSHGDQWRQKHADQYRNSMNTYCAPLMGIAVGDIDTAMTIKVLEPQWKRVPVTMDRVRRRIGEVLGYAQVRGLRQPGPLPTDWVNHLDQMLPHPRALKPTEHHATLGYAAVPDLFAKLTATDAIPELALAFTTLTATRSQEARAARWDEIDLANKVWVVPPSRMKRKREHKVPLSDEAIRLIERLPRNGEHLFAINKGGKPIVAMSLRKALQRHSGNGFTVHGMRSAFRDWGSEQTTAPREVLEHALAHVVGTESERAYARSDMLQKRRVVMQTWADHCSGKLAASNVVALHGGER